MAWRFRMIGVRLACLLAVMIGGLRPASANAEALRVGAPLCHAETAIGVADNAGPRRFRCDDPPSAYQRRSLWLKANLRPSNANDAVLMVHQTRFDRLAVGFGYADGVTVWQHVRSGDFGAHWRVGGQIAFEAPVRDAALVSATMRFDRLTSHELLRIRLVSRAEAGMQTAMLGAIVGAALTLLLLGAVYNFSLAAAMRRRFLAWHGGWAACVLVWGIIWSQIELLIVPELAGTGAAQLCTFLACMAITAASMSAATALGNGLLPRAARIAVATLGIAIGGVGIPAALERGSAIGWIGDLLGLLVLADLALVSVSLGWAWRKGSAEARDLALAWSVPMAALALTQMIDVGAALWGGGAQLLMLFAAALQTLWLSIAATRRLARLRIERDRARAAEAQASELAGRDPLTGLRNRRGFIERIAPLLEKRPMDIPVALLLIDLDRFKAINDVHGHEAGDLVLSAIARRLERWESASCAVARLGGEEFALLIVGLHGFALARFADGVRRELAACDVSATGEGLSVTASIGVVEAHGAEDFQQLYRLADRALYAAKQAGRDRVVVQRRDEKAEEATAVRRAATRPSP